LLNTKVAELKEVSDGIKVRLEGPNLAAPEQTFEKVLVSVGRKPNTDIPGLENTRVTKCQKGFIDTDLQRRTKDPVIFAIGDIAGEPMLAHKASHEARVAVEAIQGKKTTFEPQAIPAVVFTDPEIAWCGLTETQAQAEGRQVKIARFPWAASGRAVTLDRMEGVTKLVLDPETEQVLGVGICGPNAGEMISEGTLAVEMSAVVDDLALTIHPHPTLSETVMEAAESFHGVSTHIYRPKR
jgi:dihydrolipoamide dehydrogenase